MSSVKEQMAKIIHDQPEDSSYDEFLESWHSLECLNEALLTLMNVAPSGMRI